MGKYGRGDHGETDLRAGLRVFKDDERIETCGVIDELSSILGIVRSIVKDHEMSRILLEIQEHLFMIGAEVSSIKSEAGGDAWIKNDHLKFLEKLVENYESKLPSTRGFIYPGGTIAASILYLARAIARRAERRFVSLSRRFEVNPKTMAYINRLSTLLYFLARYLNHRDGVEEPIWRKS